MLLRLWTFLSLLLFSPPTLLGELAEEDYARLRQRMVAEDLKARGIEDPQVLEAMASVPRHLFVPERFRSQAYEDHPLSIGHGQTISQPYVVGLMTQLLELKGDERVLEVGTGSGYQAAVLSRLVSEVYTIEIIPSLAERASEALARLGYSNVQVKTGDGFFGWPEKAPFDAILLTASAPQVPEPLWDQLRDRGRLVLPLGETHRTQRLVRARKVEGQPKLETITDVLFVPMTGEAETPVR